MLIERWERWATYGAIANVVLIAVAIALTIDVPSRDESPAAWASFFDENHGRFIASGVLVLVAGTLYLWWLSAVRVVLLRAEPPPAGLVSLAVYGGIVALIFGLAGSAVGTAYPASVDFYDDFGGDGRLAMLLNTTAYWLGGMAFAGASVMKVAVAVIVFRTAVLPRWFGWLTAMAAVLEIAGSAVWPAGAVVSLAWVLTFATLMLRSPERPDAPAPRSVLG